MEVFLVPVGWYRVNGHPSDSLKTWAGAEGIPLVPNLLGEMGGEERGAGGYERPGLKATELHVWKKKQQARKVRKKSSIRRQRKKDCFVSAYAADELRLKYIRQRAIF